MYITTSKCPPNTVSVYISCKLFSFLRFILSDKKQQSTLPSELINYLCKLGIRIVWKDSQYTDAVYSPIMSSKTFNLTLHEYANGRMFFNEIRRYYEFLFMSGHDCMRKCGPTTENAYAVLVFFLIILPPNFKGLY